MTKFQKKHRQAWDIFWNSISNKSSLPKIRKTWSLLESFGTIVCYENSDDNHIVNVMNNSIVYSLNNNTFESQKDLKKKVSNMLSQVLHSIGYSIPNMVIEKCLIVEKLDDDKNYISSENILPLIKQIKSSKADELKLNLDKLGVDYVSKFDINRK